MPKYTQANRPMRVDTPLDTDVLLLHGFNGLEGVSQLFSFQLELFSTETDIDQNALLGQPMVITIDLPRGEKRWIHGIVRRMAQLGRTDDIIFYRAEVVPWLWRLTLTRESRIYQELSVPDILEQVFKRVGQPEYELRLTRTYTPRNYCVQYRETHLNFVSRLMEEEGIFYFFEHSDDKHVMVLSDDSGAAKPALTAEIVRFETDAAQVDDVVHDFESEMRLQAGKVTIWDYDFLQPRLKLEASLGDALEIYDFPGKYSNPEDGERIARLLLEAEEAATQVLRGSGTVHGFEPGFNFTLTKHYRPETNAKYLITQVQHFAQAGSVRSFYDSAAYDYHNTFLAIPFDTPFRAPRHTPRPTIHGTQSAIVVGPPGEEIHVDSHGRVKIQFFWDRDGKMDEKSSCWVRVTTPWGGKGYGSVSLPRIGNEVAVAFEEGDPDHPLIIGSVFNADQTPPFSLPGAGIQMGMKSRSSPGGGGTNEITMTDTKGKEMMNIHAQYDSVTTIEHDDTQHVINDRTISVDGKHTETVKKDTSITIAEGAYSHDVKAGTSTSHVKGAVKEDYDATQATTVKSDITIVSSGGGIAIAADAKHVYIKAATSIQLDVGGSNIWMDSGGQISIKGSNITIHGSANVTIKGGTVHSEADSEHQTKGAIVLSEGSATNTVKGGMVMLNP